MRLGLVLTLLCVAAAARAQSGDEDGALWEECVPVIDRAPDELVSIGFGGILHPVRPLDRGAYQLAVVRGHRINTHLTVGLGTGFVWLNSVEGHYVEKWDEDLWEWYDDWVPDRRGEYISMPMFIRIEGRLMDRWSSPVASLDAGWFVNLRARDRSMPVRGFFMRPTVGWSWRIGDLDLGIKFGGLYHKNTFNGTVLSVEMGWSF